VNAVERGRLPEDGVPDERIKLENLSISYIVQSRKIQTMKRRLSVGRGDMRNAAE
jgi:hypothetical protein